MAELRFKVGDRVIWRGTVARCGSVSDRFPYRVTTPHDGSGAWVPESDLVPDTAGGLPPSTDYCRGYAEGQHHAKARPHSTPDYTRIPKTISDDYRAGYLRGFRECLDQAVAALGDLPALPVPGNLF